MKSDLKGSNTNDETIGNTVQPQETIGQTETVAPTETVE